MTLTLPASTGEALLVGEAGDSACLVASPLPATPTISQSVQQTVLDWPADVLRLAELSTHALNTACWLQICRRSRVWQS